MNPRLASDPQDGLARLPPHVAKPLEVSWTEAQAYAFCKRLTTSHYENFPVGSFLIPSSLRPAVHSLYAFMRTADDFADSEFYFHPENDSINDPPQDQRLRYLNTWKEMLRNCTRGEAQHPVFIALAATLKRHDLPVQWLEDLLTAFTMDVTVQDYATYDDLLNYCRYSANPVGRLILTLFGYRNEALYSFSDSICTGLQLANHWQDVAVDLEIDRVYLPQEDLARFGIDAGELSTYVEKPIDSRFRELMKFEVARTRRLFEQGRSLPENVKGRLRWELRLTWQGGVRVLDKIEATGYDVFRRRPVVTKWDWFKLGLGSVKKL